MDIEFETNELPPLNICKEDFWDTAVKKLIDNSWKVLPVYFGIPASYEPAGDLFFILKKEGKNTFIQAEGFNSPLTEKGFLNCFPLGWEPLQPGIYRLDITNNIECDLKY